MKIFPVLFGHNLARRATFVWQIQRHRRIVPTNAEKNILAVNPALLDVIEDATKVAGFMKPELDPPKKKVHQTQRKVTTVEEKPAAYKFNNNYLLQEGIVQAQALTNTIVVENELPACVQKLTKALSNEEHTFVKRALANSAIFDAYQTKLPKKKDPNRPAWNFPREYGISRERQMNTLTRRLLTLCESLSPLEIIASRKVVENVELLLCLALNDDFVNLSTNVNSMIMSTNSLPPFKDPEESTTMVLPDMSPLHPVLGLLKMPDIETNDHYPISEKYTLTKPHTILLHHNSDEIRNLTEIPANESQINGHTLIRSFIAAACFARQKYGFATRFPKPVTLQCVQTDGQAWNFAAFQLNTLNSRDSIKNYFWLTPKMLLYEVAGYENGKPVLRGYNPAVFETMLALYKNTNSIFDSELN